MSKKETKSLPFFGIGKVLPFLKKYRGAVAIMMVCGLLGSAMDVGIPLFQRFALDHFIGGNTLDGIWLFALGYFAAILGAGGANYISCAYATIIEVRVLRDLRNAAFNHLQTLSFSYFNQNSVGYIHARVMSDTGRIGTLVSWRLVDCVWHGSYLLGSIGVMLAINARLALLVMAILPLIILLFSLFQKKLIKVNREIREINSTITGDFNEGITGAKTVKSLAIEEQMQERFCKDTQNMRRKTVRSARLRGLFGATMNLASSMALAIVLWKGGYIAQSEVGTFSMFMSYAQGMMEPVRWMIDVITDLITTQVNIERLTNLLETRSDVTDRPEVIEQYGNSFEPKTENWEPIRGDIAFRDVDFMYPDGDEYVLKNFNLTIPFGTNLAIVGETGAGKSTLVNLICRFFEPTRGQVLIDGKDARDRSQIWLHSAIGYVLQTPHLFSGTVRENLLYGNPNATEEQIANALKLVAADEVVARLEKGLDTDVGEGGDLLSTVRNADLILVVKNGKIVEQGKHADLLAARGYYYKLYTRQYEDEATQAILN